MSSTSSNPPRLGILFDKFVRIRRSVWTEYGDSLTVNASTVYENLPESVILLIRHTALQVD